MQLAFMYQELRGYKTLFAILTTTDSIREASDAFMTQYEKLSYSFLEKEKAQAVTPGLFSHDLICYYSDAHCNGDMHAALEYARQIKHEQKDFLTQQGIEAIF